MDKKRKIILDTSMNLFLEKGFQKTSVQDIAEACNISKTTIYKLFSAKEDIAVNVILYIQQQLAQDLAQVEARTDLDIEGKIQSTIFILFTHYQKKMKFVDYLHLFLSPEQRTQYIPVLTKARFTMFTHYADALQRIYNLPSESLAWELTLTMHGMIRELSLMETLLPNEGNIPQLDQATTMNFIVESLQAISKERINAKPMIPLNKITAMKNYFSIPLYEQPKVSTKEDVLQQLKEKIRKSVPNGTDHDLLQTIDLLEQEYQNGKPNPIVIKALWLYLAQSNDLLPLLNQFEPILTK